MWPMATVPALPLNTVRKPETMLFETSILFIHAWPSVATVLV